MNFAGRLIAASLFLIVVACDLQSPPATQTQSDAPQVKIVEDAKAPLGQLPDTVRPTHYRIDLTIRPDQPRYAGIVEIDLDLKEAQRDVYLHGDKLDVSEVTARAGSDTIKGTYAQVHKSGVARLTFERPLPQGAATVRIVYSSAFESEPDALTVMQDNGDKYAWTQFEAVSARRAFPGFDEPRFKVPFDVTITARPTDTVVANTLPTNEEKLPDGLKKTTFATTKPLPTYLTAFIVGPYDAEQGPTLAASKLRKESVPLRGITVRGKGARARYALNQTPALMSYLETYFAAPFAYPKLDLITPPNFTAGGMENAGAITYTERGILLDASASIQQKRYFSLLHAHEVAHQWFGDFVTPKWWDDIWLNESFATWMGNKSAAGVWREGEFDRETVRDALDAMDLDSLATARAIRQPIKSNDDIANAFDSLTYDKGGAVLQMFESYAGADAFREGVRAHMRRFPHGVADVHDFMESLAQGAGKPELAPAFETFLNKPGVPLVRTQSACIGRDLNVTLTQSPFGAKDVNDPRVWSVPVCMRDLKSGKAQACTLLTARSATVSFKNQCGAVLMPNTAGAGYYRFSMPRAEWQALIAAAPSMTPAEQMATLHSARAAFRTGDVDAATYLATLKAIGTTAAWDTLEIVEKFLTELRGNLLAKADVPIFQKQVRSWFTPALAKLGLERAQRETPAAALLRASLAELLVKVGREPGTLSALAAKGVTRLRAETTPDAPVAIAPELVEAALWSAVKSGGAQIAHEAIDAIKGSSDAEFRRSAIQALTAATEPAAIAEIQEFAASSALRVRERRDFLRTLFNDPDSRAAAWNWLRKDFKRLSAPVPAEGRSRFIDLASRLCTDTAHAEIEWFFKPMVEELVGAPRTYANTLESVDRCTAWHAARGPEVATALRQMP